MCVRSVCIGVSSGKLLEGGQIKEKCFCLSLRGGGELGDFQPFKAQY